MKILFVTGELGMRGGERQMLLLRQGLERRGCQVKLCARKGAEVLQRFDHHCIASMANSLDLIGARAIHRAAQEADLVHAFDARAHALSVRCGRPLVVTRAVAYRAGKTIFGRLKYKAGAHFIAVSRAAAAALEAAGAEARVIHLIPPALERTASKLTREQARERWGIPPEAKAIGCIAALSEEKGLEVLLECFARLSPGCALRIVGDGPLRSDLEALAKKLGIGGPVFLGRVEEIDDVLAALDLYVQPSRSEGFGVAALEAMAAGLPVIASDAGGLAEVVRDGVTGWLVPVGDPARLGAAITSALSDPVEARRRAQAAGAEAESRYTVDAMAEATLEAYRSALQG